MLTEERVRDACHKQPIPRSCFELLVRNLIGSPTHSLRWRFGRGVLEGVARRPVMSMQGGPHLGALSITTLREHIKYNAARRKVIDFFRDLNESGSGHMTVSEFAKGIKVMGFEATPEQIKRTFAALDAAGKGAVTAKAFDTQIRGRDKPQAELADGEDASAGDPTAIQSTTPVEKRSDSNTRAPTGFARPVGNMILHGDRKNSLQTLEGALEPSQSLHMVAKRFFTRAQALRMEAAALVESPELGLRIGITVNELVAGQGVSVEEMPLRLDKSKDGSISKTEFRSGIRSSPASKITWGLGVQADASAIDEFFEKTVLESSGRSNVTNNRLTHILKRLQAQATAALRQQADLNESAAQMQQQGERVIQLVQATKEAEDALHRVRHDHENSPLDAKIGSMLLKKNITTHTVIVSAPTVTPSTRDATRIQPLESIPVSPRANGSILMRRLYRRARGTTRALDSFPKLNGDATCAKRASLEATPL